MNFSTLFVRRPVATTLIQLAIVIFGIAAYRALPVSDLPPIDFPTISVNASLPGANPDTLAAAVATPLEKQFSTIPGRDANHVHVGARQHVDHAAVRPRRNIDAAAQDVQTAISRSLRQLPANMPAPPSYNKVNPADQPVFFLALSSQTLPLSQVNEYAESILAQRISMVSGVAQVQVFGAQRYAVRVDLDPAAARRAQHRRGSGLVRHPARQREPADRHALRRESELHRVRENGQLYSAAEFGPLIVAYQGGRPCT
jgi:HAE1 family hydrophobic/amphiphilic exporter-1